MFHFNSDYRRVTSTVVFIKGAPSRVSDGLVADLPMRRTRFNSTPVYVEFVVNQMELGQIFVE